MIERRKRTEAAPAGYVSQSEELRRGVETLEADRGRLVRERAAQANVIDRCRAELAAVEDRYRREGGALFERRAELEGEAVANERALEAARKELREIAAGAAPLLMVSDLLASLKGRAAIEEESRRSRETASVVAEEHEAMLALPSFAALPERVRDELQEALNARLHARRGAAAEPVVLNLSEEARDLLAALQGSELAGIRDRVQEALDTERDAIDALDHARDTLAASPSYDAIAEVVAVREAAQADVKRLESQQEVRDDEIACLDREIAQLREREARAAEAEARERFEREDVQRLLLHSAKVRSTLGRFHEAVVARHVARIERLVLGSFHQLIRKGTLVADLRIDPKTFVIELRGSDGRAMTPERLSAGERQLLAIAILWGLGKSSGRPLPTVIDTPMGRLDFDPPHSSR